MTTKKNTAKATEATAKATEATAKATKAKAYEVPAIMTLKSMTTNGDETELVFRVAAQVKASGSQTVYRAYKADAQHTCNFIDFKELQRTIRKLFSVEKTATEKAATLFETEAERTAYVRKEVDKANTEASRIVNAWNAKHGDKNGTDNASDGKAVATGLNIVKAPDIFHVGTIQVISQREAWKYFQRLHFGDTQVVSPSNDGSRLATELKYLKAITDGFRSEDVKKAKDLLEDFTGRALKKPYGRDTSFDRWNIRLSTHGTLYIMYHLYKTTSDLKEYGTITTEPESTATILKTIFTVALATRCGVADQAALKELDGYASPEEKAEAEAAAEAAAEAKAEARKKADDESKKKEARRKKEAARRKKEVAESGSRTAKAREAAEAEATREEAKENEKK